MLLLSKGQITQTWSCSGQHYRVIAVHHKFTTFNSLLTPLIAFPASLLAHSLSPPPPPPRAEGHFLVIGQWGCAFGWGCMSRHFPWVRTFWGFWGLTGRLVVKELFPYLAMLC